jgi:dTDP-4-dehydrorhamnose reductase
MLTSAPILLIGKNGQIGFELEKILPRLGNLIALGRKDLDLSNLGETRRMVQQLGPRLIVNAAAYTAVDQAETDQRVARALNAEAPAVLAEAAKEIGAGLVHFSTDYVFDGRKNSPYVEDDPTNPLSVYGRTKLAGELAIRQSGIPHLILRTAWVYGTRGRNFLLTILRLASERQELRIVGDQTGAPTWCRAIAEATVSILKNLFNLTPVAASFGEFSGTYHVTAGAATTWFDFARAILDQASRTSPNVPWFAAATASRPLCVQRMVAITTAEYPTPARRPIYSVLSNERLFRAFQVRLPDWQTQLLSAFSER